MWWLKKKEKRIPRAGEFWEFITKNPLEIWPVRILDIKKDIVHYDMGVLFRSEYMKLTDFLKKYKVILK